jgi:hypothetical protein
MIRIFLAFAFLAGCSGVKDLGWHTMPDGSKFGGYSVKNPGVSGPDVTALQTFRCPVTNEVVGECKSAGNFSGAAPGAVEVGVAGMGAATMHAVGAGVAAHLLRPDRTNITGVSGDVGANANVRTDVDVNQNQKGIGGSGGNATNGPQTTNVAATLKQNQVQNLPSPYPGD